MWSSTTTPLTSIQGESLARSPSPLHLPLHPDLVFLGQRSRGLVCQTHPTTAKRGIFTSIVELQAAINRFIADANVTSKPFVWAKSADAILAAVNRGRQALEAIH